MSDTYVVVVYPDLEIATLKVNNISVTDHRVGMHNISEWLESTEIGRYEFAPDYCLWWTSNEKDLNLVGTGLIGNRKSINGNIVITTWTRRGIDAQGINEEELPMVWGWLEEVISYNKFYMDTHDMTLSQLRHFVKREIEGESE